MLKVIAEDFIKPECVDNVLLYTANSSRQRRKSPCVLLMICTGMKRIWGILFSLKSGLTGQHSIHTVPASILLGLFL